MAQSSRPVNGMKDILPKEERLRDYVTGVIRDTYKSFGFTPVETPCMENIQNLLGGQGGENEKLIFRVLKRGEKLDVKGAEEVSDVSDLGMRYDLTVPLARYFAQHESELPSPFMALQMGPVWRADRPQRGRFRQFCQCDIDIIGDSSNLAEITLLTATSTALGRLGFSGFEIRLNDRRLLSSIASFCGFSERDFEKVFIILDKLDKIGQSGVSSELCAAGYPDEAAERLLSLLSLFPERCGVKEGLKILRDLLSDSLDFTAADNLQQIAEAAEAAKEADFSLVFDPTLVRGMSYYTGPIFEIAMPNFGISCGGGGRYDQMVGRFSGRETPACGFSVGFERIILLLCEQGFIVPSAQESVVYLVDKKCGGEKIAEVMRQAAEARAAGDVVLVISMNKNKKFQKERLRAEGYERFVEFFA